MKTGGGGVGNELSLRFIILLLRGLSCVFTVMSEVNLDELGFTAPVGSTVPQSSDSSVEHPPDGRSKCVACPRRMSAKTADRHTVCVVCRGYDCNLETRCEECIEWPEEEIRLYAKMRKSLKSKGSSKHRNKPSASPPPPAVSMPSLQPHVLANMQTQVDSLNALVNTLSESLFARMDALQASLAPSIPQPSSRPSHRPDAGSPQPGVTVGESRMFQALGETSQKTEANVRVDQGGRTPRREYASRSAASQPHAAPGTAPQPSAAFVPPQPPPRSEVPRLSLGVSGSGLSRSRLLVRHLRRGLGCSPGFSHRFRPLGSRSGLSVHQRSGASGHQGGSPPFPVISGREECVRLLRQQHGGVISPQGGGHQVSVSQLPDSGDSALDGVPLHPSVAPRVAESESQGVGGFWLESESESDS